MAAPWPRHGRPGTRAGADDGFRRQGASTAVADAVALHSVGVPVSPDQKSPRACGGRLIVSSLVLQTGLCSSSSVDAGLENHRRGLSPTTLAASWCRLAINRAPAPGEVAPWPTRSFSAPTARCRWSVESFSVWAFDYRPLMRPATGASHRDCPDLENG